DLGLIRNAVNANLAQAQASDRVGEPAGLLRRTRALRRLHEEGRGEDIARAGEALHLDVDARDLQRPELTRTGPQAFGFLRAHGVIDRGALRAAGDDAHTPLPDPLDDITRLEDLLVAHDRAIDPVDEVHRQPKLRVPDNAATLARPVSHPTLRCDAEEPGREPGDAPPVDLVS